MLVPSKTIPLDVLITSTLFIVCVPVTVKLGIVIVLPELPILVLPIWPSLVSRFDTLTSTSVFASEGNCIVFKLTAVTCPVAFVLTLSIAVNVSEAALLLSLLVVSDLVVESWFIVSVSSKDWSTVKSPPPLK